MQDADQGSLVGPVSGRTAGTMRGLGALLGVALAVGCSRSDAPAAGAASASAVPVASAPVAPSTASEAPPARPVASAVALPERRALPAHRLEVPGGGRLVLLVDEHHWHVVDDRSSEWGTWVREGAILRPPGLPTRPLVALAGSPETGAIELRIDDEAPRSIKVSARTAPRPVPEPVTPRPKDRRLGTAALRPRAAPEVPGVLAVTASYAGDAAYSPAVSAPAYVVVAKAIAVEPVPSTGDAAVAALAMLLALAGAARLRRRR